MCRRALTRQEAVEISRKAIGDGHSGTLDRISTALNDEIEREEEGLMVVAPTPRVAAIVGEYYLCPSGTNWHLWVSAMQAADGSRDDAITQEGAGFGCIAAAWLQSHPVTFKCDGKWHTQKFRIDTEEQGYGELIRGYAWVQFCLIDEPAEVFLIDQHWSGSRYSSTLITKPSRNRHTKPIGTSIWHILLRHRPRSISRRGLIRLRLVERRPSGFGPAPALPLDSS
jgi:hypothetical protein